MGPGDEDWVRIMDRISAKCGRADEEKTEDEETQGENEVNAQEGHSLDLWTGLEVSDRAVSSYLRF